MEYIQGGRVDDLVYLSDHNIDRNKVALELARIFCQMVHINGWFHAVSSFLSPRKSYPISHSAIAGPTPGEPAHPPSGPRVEVAIQL